MLLPPTLAPAERARRARSFIVRNAGRTIVAYAEGLDGRPRKFTFCLWATRGAERLLVFDFVEGRKRTLCLDLVSEVKSAAPTRAPRRARYA